VTKTRPIRFSVMALFIVTTLAALWLFLFVYGDIYNRELTILSWIICVTCFVLLIRGLLISHRKK
jgi:hypothetical protein